MSMIFYSITFIYIFTSHTKCTVKNCANKKETTDRHNLLLFVQKILMLMMISFKFCYFIAILYNFMHTAHDNEQTFQRITSKKNMWNITMDETYLIFMMQYNFIVYYIQSNSFEHRTSNIEQIYIQYNTK